jgi:hypothetical protein
VLQNASITWALQSTPNCRQRTRDNQNDRLRRADDEALAAVVSAKREPRIEPASLTGLLALEQDGIRRSYPKARQQN